MERHIILLFLFLLVPIIRMKYLIGLAVVVAAAFIVI